MLQRLFENALSAGNAVLARDHLEQAAKEMGGMFNGQRNIVGEAAPLFPVLTPIEAREELMQRVAAARLRAGASS